MTARSSELLPGLLIRGCVKRTRHLEPLAVFARQQAIGLLVVDEPLGFSVEHQRAADAVRNVAEVRQRRRQVALEHVLVDNCAMALVHKPTHFDTIVTENTFGDILSDEAAILAGSMGMLPSASIGGRVGLYEPVHGTAPDIAGQGVANPIAAILSAAMLLRYSLSLGADADRIDAAVIRVLEQGHRTRDIHAAGTTLVGTKEMGDLISAEVEKSYA